jgi:NADH:ubiquinone oxidoreductase subunit 6 (subunit J)
LYSEAVPLLLSAALVGVVAVALFSSKVSTSLIMLFYASIVLGATFTLYGDSLVGLLEMITFAGAVSVLLLTVILMTGQPDLTIGVRRASIIGTLAALSVAAACAYAIFVGSSGTPSLSSNDISIGVLGFIWQYRQWDVLILVTVFASAMVTVANLLSEGD